MDTSIWQTEIIAITPKLSSALKKGKMSLCQLHGCSLSVKQKITVTPHFSAFIWTAMGPFLNSQFSCSTTSFLVNYAFQTRKQCTCASLKLLRCFSSTFRSWKCKKRHPKSDQWPLQSIFSILMSTRHRRPMGKCRFINFIKYFLNFFPCCAQVLGILKSAYLIAIV